MHRNRSFIRWGVVFLVLALLGTTAWLLSQETAEGLYEAALLKKEANGDLQGAIQLFHKILKQFPEKREIAAKAQFQIGACYEKMGTAEAVKAYELVLKNFADQPELVAAARERLTALKSTPSSARLLISIPRGNEEESFDVSPDGTKVLGLNYEFGDNIVVHDTVTNQTEFVTHFDFSEGSFWTDVPVWSPDGREIAFEQCPNKPGVQRSELRIANLQGESRLLFGTEDGEIWPMDWLPKRGVLLCVRLQKDQSYALGLVPLRGGPFTALCPVRGGPWGPWCDASPDERYVVFSEGGPRSRNIRIVGIEGGTSRSLIDHPANELRPLWSPDGRHIVFESNRQGGDSLWGLAVKDGQAEGEPFLIEEMIPRSNLLNWTSQGLAFSKSTEISDILVQPIDPQILVPVGKPRPIPSAAPGRSSCLRWSPDGKSVAFATTTSDLPAEVRLVVQPSEGGKARDFLAPVFLWEPSLHTLAWDPSGQRLGFATYGMNTENMQASLLILDIASGEWKTYLLPDMPYSPTHIEWGRDGKSIYYTLQGDVADPGIVEYSLETEKQRFVYRPEKGEDWRFSSLRRSRDHQWIVFHQESHVGPGPTKLRQVLALKIETGEIRKIYAGTDGVGSPVWSPDGRTLLVLYGIEASWTRDKGRELAFVPAASGPLKQMKLDVSWPVGSDFKHGFVSPDWSPDGTQIAVTALSVNEEIYMIKNVIPANRKK